MKELTNSMTSSSQINVRTLASELVNFYYSLKGEPCSLAKRDSKITKVLEMLALSEKIELNQCGFEEKMEQSIYQESQLSIVDSDLGNPTPMFNQNNETYREMLLFSKCVQMPLKNLSSQSESEQPEISSTNVHPSREKYTTHEMPYKQIENQQSTQEQALLKNYGRWGFRKSNRIRAIVKYEESMEQSLSENIKCQEKESSVTPILSFQSSSQSISEENIPKPTKKCKRTKNTKKKSQVSLKKKNKKVSKSKYYQTRKPLGRKPEFPQMQSKLVQWINRMLKKEFRITQSNIRSRAKIIMLKLDKKMGQNFKASKGWIQKFFRRHPDISQKISLTNQRKLHEIDLEKQDQFQNYMNNSLLLNITAQKK